MYNLFVTADDEQWKRTVCEYEGSRAIEEYTESTIWEKFKRFDKGAIDELKSFPCLFVYEGKLNKDARLGRIKSIKKNGITLRIEYELFDFNQRISFAKIKKLKLELNISDDWELERTQWSVKDVDLISVLITAEIIDENIDRDFLVKLRGEVAVRAEILKIYGEKDIVKFHEKILGRVVDDPEGAITGACSLLESVCKQVLDKRSVSYDRKDDLSMLYRKTAKELKLAPTDHSEEAVKQIFGGCVSVVQGIGTLRNSLGDAHGRGLNAIKPDVLHARLAINLATAISSYLLELSNK